MARTMIAPVNAPAESLMVILPSASALRTAARPPLQAEVKPVKKDNDDADNARNEWGNASRDQPPTVGPGVETCTNRYCTASAAVA